MYRDLHFLREKCLQLAAITMRRKGLTDAILIKNHADRLYTVARAKTREFGVGMTTITRAVDYLTQAHANPEMKDDLDWFDHMLSALLMVASPDMVPEGQGKDFLEDLRSGLKRSLSR